MNQFFCQDITCRECKLIDAESGDLAYLNEEELIYDIKHDNLKCLNVEVDEGKIVKNKRTMDNLEAYKIYMSKQKLLNTKIFEFSVNNYGVISIIGYIDNPKRERIVVPDFVSIINYGAFRNTKYVKKIVFNNNLYIIKGAFEELDCKEIEIDGDMSNIMSLDELFSSSRELETVTISDRANAKNIVATRSMFIHCEKLKTINFGNTLDLGSIKSIYCMFEDCKDLVEIKSGYKFSKSNLVEAFRASYNCNENFIKSLDKFGITREDGKNLG